MSRRCLRGLTLGLFCLVIGGAFQGCSAAFRKKSSQEPTISVAPVQYQSFPNIPSEDQAVRLAGEAANDAAWAATEAHGAAAAARTAEAEEVAVKHELETTKKALETKLVVKRATETAEESIKFRHGAENAATSSRKMEDEIEVIAQAAAKRAVKDVIAKAIKEMETEAGQVRDQALAERRKAFVNAAKMAEQEALPFQQAKMRAEKNQLEFLNRAHQLAQTVMELKKESLRLGGTANAYQQAGIPVVANKLLHKAKDMMDKAMQIEKMMHATMNRANAIGGTMLPFSLATSAALAYGAYYGNPAGVRPDIPGLPAPLEMPPPAKKK